MHLTSLKKRPFFNTISLALTLFCTAFVIYKSTECFTKFLRRPKSNEVSIEHASKNPYPTITICPEKSVYVDFLMTSCNISFGEYLFRAKWFGNEGNQSICSDAAKLFDNMAGVPEDTVKSLYQVDFRLNMLVLLDRLSPTSNWRYAFHSIDSYENIRCFSYEPIDSAFILVLHFKRNVKIYIHNRGDYITSTSRNFKLNIGQIVNMDIGYEYLQMLEFDGIECRNYFDEHRDSCIDAYINQESLKRFGCITPYHKVKANICTNQTLGLLASNLWKLENRHNTESACPLSCEYISIRLGRTSERYSTFLQTNSKTSQLYLRFEQFIKVSRTQISYGGLELLAEVGGYVGLFLGVSIVKVIGLLEVFYNKWKHLVNQIMQRM